MASNIPQTSLLQRLTNFGNALAIGGGLVVVLLEVAGTWEILRTYAPCSQRPSEIIHPDQASGYYLLILALTIFAFWFSTRQRKKKGYLLIPLFALSLFGAWYLFVTHNFAICSL